ncbi:DUF1566 domain-containing protein [Sorangium sp. So ce1014]|uniref:Lcl C-terminal domain-containing protein n=1 Tax=Sorangium sp. So ce1014 TaxID=3133326 RepID=UPI003F5E251A
MGTVFDPTTASDTVFDSVTELQWQRGVVPDPKTGKPGDFTWEGAKNECERLVLEGHDDWRMPSRIELVSIVDYATVRPAIPDAKFPGTVNVDEDYLWSLPIAKSSDPEHPELPTRAWCVHVLDGASVECMARGEKLVRCVRGGKPTSGERCVNQLDGEEKTVTDKQTGLTWQRNVDGISRFRKEATDYCNEFGLAGLTWRLPTVQELRTIVDHARLDLALDPESFPEPEPCPALEPCPDWYWSSTDYPYALDHEEQAWGVGFKVGHDVIKKEEIDKGRVRCVADDGP